jgi:hypothetical protein
MFEDRIRILSQMGFVCGNLAFDRLDKRIVQLISDPINFTGNIYAPEIRVKVLETDSIKFVKDLFTVEMIPDILDNLNKQLGGTTPVSARLKEEIQETIHEVSLMLKSLKRESLI